MNLIVLFQSTLAQVAHTLLVNWPFLAVSALVAALMRVYVDQNKVAAFLQRRRGGNGGGRRYAAVFVRHHRHHLGHDGQHDALGTYRGVHGRFAPHVA